MAYALAAGVLIGLGLGGRLEALGRLRIRWYALALGGLVVQVVLFSPLAADGLEGLAPILYVASTALVAVVVVRNVKRAGFAVIALGALANLAAIVTNGGYMPVAPEVLASAGRAASGAYSNSLTSASPALPMLVDRFALPAWLPLANVFSVGDVLIGLGLVIAIVVAMEPAQPLELRLAQLRVGWRKP